LEVKLKIDIAKIDKLVNLKRDVCLVLLYILVLLPWLAMGYIIFNFADCSRKSLCSCAGTVTVTTTGKNLKMNC
jgi:hypothetical protein